MPFFLEKRVMVTGLKPLNHFRLKAVLRLGMLQVLLAFCHRAAEGQRSAFTL